MIGLEPGFITYGGKHKYFKESILVRYDSFTVEENDPSLVEGSFYSLDEGKTYSQDPIHIDGEVDVWVRIKDGIMETEGMVVASEGEAVWSKYKNTYPCPKNTVAIVSYGVCKLNKLQLNQLPKLVSIGADDMPVELKTIRVSNCPIYNEDIGAWRNDVVAANKVQFSGCAAFEGIGIEHLNVSEIVTVDSMFRDCSSFNGDITKWNLDKITAMYFFLGGSAFNRDISHWDVSKIRYMRGTFHNAQYFNQPLDNWDVSNVTNMSLMFHSAQYFNQPIGSWDVSSVTNMEGMFHNCSSFNQDLAMWCVSKIPVKPSAFDTGADSWVKQRPQWGKCPPRKLTLRLTDGRMVQPKTYGPIENSNIEITKDVNTYIKIMGNDLEAVLGWHNVFDDTVKGFRLESANLVEVPVSLPSWVTTTDGMFRRCTSFNQPLNDWDMSDITSTREMFMTCSSFNQPLDKWVTSKVTSMVSMFQNCTNFNQDLSGWDVSSVTNMEGMFRNAQYFNQPLDNWDVSNVTNMSLMFRTCASFNQPIGSWDVSSVTNMEGMFHNCTNFNQDLSGWCVSKITAPPSDFDTNTTAWTKPKPVWGTCPAK